MAIIDDFMMPDVPPETPYSPKVDVVAWRFLDDGTQAAEVFRRVDGTLGFRFNAWVAWRDAGNFVRSRSWHEVGSISEMRADSIEEVIRVADTEIGRLGANHSGEWTYET